LDRSNWVVPGLTATVIVLIFVATVLAGNRSTDAQTVNALVDRWLAAMAGAEEDRGWSMLAPEARWLFGNDRDDFLAEVAGQDWSQIRWAPAEGYVDDGVFYSGHVAILSDPSTIPGLLADHGMAFPMCIDGIPHGITLTVRVGWFVEPRFGESAGKSWIDKDCWAAMQESRARPHEPFDAAGIAWGSPGANQRVGVHDEDGLVSAISAGRERPPIDGAASVDQWDPDSVAVAWRGSSCDRSTGLLVAGTPDEIEIVVERRVTTGDCVAADVVFETIIDFDQHVRAESIDVRLDQATSRATPRATTPAASDTLPA
jgi:hypothetical protein